MSAVALPAVRLDGPILLRPPRHSDDRGWLQESYRADHWAAMGIGDEFVQDNHSRSRQGVLRGMHFQIGPGQAKLIRCVRGTITDVLVDVRPGSETFGQWESFELDGERLEQLYCPVGFAHGFCVTSGPADVLYKCSTYYDPELERAIAWDDPDVGVRWPAEVAPIVSPRDASAPRLRDVAGELSFESLGS